MNHVTDDRTDRLLGAGLHDWLDRSIVELPDGAELPPSVRSEVLSRLPSMPRRRRWWPLRWHPFGIGATRSADRKEARPERRSKSMFTATRVAATVAALTLAVSLALVAGPARFAPRAPGAQGDAIDPADVGGFSGTMLCAQGEYGQTTTTEWGSIVIGETYPSCLIEVSDPRISGNNYSVHDYYKYDGQPLWGVRSFSSVISNDDGTWVATDGWGYQHPEDSTMFYAGQYRGTGAYEGLSALVVLSQDRWGLRMDVEGVIIPGDLPEAPKPPIEAASGSD